MKRFLFIYREDRKAFVDPDYGYQNRIVIVEESFPKGTQNAEIEAAARRHEVKDRHEDLNTASEGVLNRALQRIVEIAREVELAGGVAEDMEPTE